MSWDVQVGVGRKVGNHLGLEVVDGRRKELAIRSPLSLSLLLRIEHVGRVEHQWDLVRIHITTSTLVNIHGIHVWRLQLLLLLLLLPISSVSLPMFM
jgi:hypothetical protein